MLHKQWLSTGFPIQTHKLTCRGRKEEEEVNPCSIKMAGWLITEVGVKGYCDKEAERTFQSSHGCLKAGNGKQGEKKPMETAEMDNSSEW